MAKVKITGHASGTGILTVTAPDTDVNRTITLPDATGTLLNSDGDGSSLTGISTPITALNSATANELVTVGATTTELDAEANLTFDGTDLTLGTGDIVFGTAGKGICLGVTTNTDANTLDDYEEGTWTPAITSTSGGSSMTYDGNTAGFYRRIGDSVFIWGFLGLTAVGNLQNGSVQIKSIPFGLKTDVAATSAGCLVSEWGGTSQDMSGAWLRYNTTERFVLYYANESTSPTALLGGQCNNTFSIRFYGQYLAA
jgi:hypothetical protein